MSYHPTYGLHPFDQPQRCPTCGAPVGPYGLELMRVARTVKARAVLSAAMSDTPDIPDVDDPVDPDDDDPDDDDPDTP